MYAFPSTAEAKIKKKSSPQFTIETPKSRLSPEIKILKKKGPNKPGWIVKNKWWVIAGLSIIAGSIFLSNGSDDSDDNSEYGKISGKW